MQLSILNATSYEIRLENNLYYKNRAPQKREGDKVLVIGKTLLIIIPAKKELIFLNQNSAAIYIKY